jgi:hypothetical protein
MRLSMKAMAFSAGILWALAILCVGLINLAIPTYGTDFLQLTSSVYPWFHNSRTVASVVIGTIDGLVDGAFAGLVLAWLYNAFSSASSAAQPSQRGA